MYYGSLAGKYPTIIIYYARERLSICLLNLRERRSVKGTGIRRGDSRRLCHDDRAPEPCNPTTRFRI